MRRKTLLSWLLGLLLLLVLAGDSHAKAVTFERLMNVAGATSTQTLKTFHNEAGNFRTLSCRLDITAINQGTIQLIFWGVMSIKSCGSSATEAGDACTVDDDCTGDTCDVDTTEFAYVTGSSVTTVSDDWTLWNRTTDIDSSVVAASANIKIGAPFPPTFILKANATGSPTFDGTVDCWWY